MHSNITSPSGKTYEVWLSHYVNSSVVAVWSKDEIILHKTFDDREEAFSNYRELRKEIRHGNGEWN